jgi:predicted nucleotidyltransferase
MSLAKQLQEKREDILSIARNYGAFNVRVFGSVARGEATSSSDLDLLIELEPQRTLLEYIALKIDLENLLNCRVDLAEPDTLHEQIRERILQEAIPLQLFLLSIGNRLHCFSKIQNDINNVL